MKYTNLSSIRRNIKKAELTEFQKAVYHVVAGIPAGRTMTYAQVAGAIGRPRAVRAVGNALNKNPFAPAVPCHRVIRSNGTIGDFAQGAVKKEALLRREGALDDSMTTHHAARPAEKAKRT